MMGNGLALHTWTLDTTPLADVLRIARSAGWDAIELRRVDLAGALEAGLSREDIVNLVRSSGLPVACVGVEPGWMFAEGPELGRLLYTFAGSCRWAGDLACRTVMSPVDWGRGDVRQAAAKLREVGDIAAEHGVRLALEFSFRAEQYNTLNSAQEVLALAGHSHCGLLLDTYYLLRSGSDPRALEDLAPGEIVYFQYSDVPRSGLKPRLALDRLPPGQGVVPFREIFRALSTKGYTGYLSYEAPNPAAWARDPEEVAREALLATRALLPNA